MGILPSPSRAGGATFESVSELVTSPPHAVAFAATRELDGGRPFVLFAKEFDGLVGTALALSADVRVSFVDAIDDRSGLVLNAGDAADAGIGEDPPLPIPHVPLIGFGAISTSIDGVQVVGSHEGLFLATGTGDVTIRRVRITDFDTISTTAVAWIRVNLVVGDPATVQAYASRETTVDVVCPKTPAVAAAWPSLPPLTVQCVEASPSFADLPRHRTAATIGIGLQTPSRARVIVDSVRVIELGRP